MTKAWDIPISCQLLILVRSDEEERELGQCSLLAEEVVRADCSLELLARRLVHRHGVWLCFQTLLESQAERERRAEAAGNAIEQDGGRQGSHAGNLDQGPAARPSAAPPRRPSADPITGLVTRADFEVFAEHTCTTASPENPWAVLLLEFQNFRDLIGDDRSSDHGAILRRVPARVERALGANTIATRFDDHQVVILVSDRYVHPLRTAGPRLRDAIQGAPFHRCASDRNAPCSELHAVVRVSAIALTSARSFAQALHDVHSRPDWTNARGQPLQFFLDRLAAALDYEHGAEIHCAASQAQCVEGSSRRPHLPAARDAYLRVKAMLLEHAWTPDLALRCHDVLAGIRERPDETYFGVQLWFILGSFDALVDHDYPNLVRQASLEDLFRTLF